MSDALVARLTRTAGDLAASGPMGALIRGDRALAFATDIDALLTALATVQAELKTLVAKHATDFRNWNIAHQRATESLATLRETLAGEVKGMRQVREPMDETNYIGCYEVDAHNAALDRAITIIRGTK